MPKIHFFLTGLLSLMFLAWYQGTETKEVTNSNLRVSQIAGKRLLELKKCLVCHTLTGKDEGPQTPMTSMPDEDWFEDHVKKESPIVLREETSKRERRRVLKEEIAALEDYLFNTKAEGKKQIDVMPQNVFEGAYLIYQNPCLKCHTIAGKGKEVGPDLSYVGKKHTKEWFLENFENPQQFAPESVMPRFGHLSKDKLEQMADYLLTLK